MDMLILLGSFFALMNAMLRNTSATSDACGMSFQSETRLKIP